VIEKRQLREGISWFFSQEKEREWSFVGRNAEGKRKGEKEVDGGKLPTIEETAVPCGHGYTLAGAEEKKERGGEETIEVGNNGSFVDTLMKHHRFDVCLCRSSRKKRLKIRTRSSQGTQRVQLSGFHMLVSARHHEAV